MPRLIISQEQIEREAKAFEDYNRKKLKQIRDTVVFIESLWETEIEKLLDRLDQELKLQATKLFNTSDMEKLLKDMGLKEEPLPKTRKKRKVKIKNYKDHKKELIKTINEILDTKDEPVKPTTTTKNSRRGRPPGSKNKPKSESSTRTRKRRGPGRPKTVPYIF